MKQISTEELLSDKFDVRNYMSDEEQLRMDIVGGTTSLQEIKDGASISALQDNQLQMHYLL